MALAARGCHLASRLVLLASIGACTSTSPSLGEYPVGVQDQAEKPASRTPLTLFFLNNPLSTWQSGEPIDWRERVSALRPTVVLEPNTEASLTLPDDLDAALVRLSDEGISRGTCRGMQGSEQGVGESIPPQADRELEIVLTEPARPHAEDRLVFVADASAGDRLLAIGRTDQNSRFSCSLPQQRDLSFYLSDGSSLFDSAPPGPDAMRRVEWKLAGPALKKIRIQKPAGAPAYLIRIAKERPTGLAAAPGLETPTELKPWLWTRPNVTRSPGLSIASYYDQSFLLSGRTLELNLPIASHAIALTNPKTNETCVIFAPEELEDGSVLQCPPAPSTAEASFLPALEGLFLPSSLETPPLPSDLSALSLEGLELAPLSRLGDSAVASLPRQLFARETASIRVADQLILDNAFFDFGDFSRADETTIARYLTSESIPELAITNHLNPRTGKSDSFNPLYLQTRALFSNPSFPTADSMLTTITNGALFYWNSVTPQSSTVPFPSDGRMAFNLYIPSYNLTDFIEIFVDGKLFRRRVIGRSDVTQPRFVRVEEEFKFKTDFQVSIYAWGKAYLPEFIYGQEKLMPRALLSRVCFDVNKNLICDNMSFEGDRP